TACAPALHRQTSARPRQQQACDLAQAVQAADLREGAIERGARGGGVLLAQRLQRLGVIFLRLLGPGAAGELEAEFLRALGNRFRIRLRPRQEATPDLLDEQRRERRREARPRFERAL